MMLTTLRFKLIITIGIVAATAGISSCSQEEDPAAPAADANTKAAVEEAGEAVEAAQTDMLARGTYVAMAMASCHGCHSEASSDPDATVFPVSGRNEGFFVAPNITQDIETGIGAWSDTDIENALRRGKRPDGSDIHPVMPWKEYAHLSDEDMSAVIAWLRSQEPISNALPKGNIAFSAEAITASPAPVSAGSADTTVARGSYVVTIGHCLRCHTPMSPETGIDYAGQLGAGGVQMGSPETPVVSANLTPHPEDGITHYTDAELAEVIKTGKRPDGTSLSPPMGPRQRLTDNDLAAVVAYLRTLPPKPYPDMSASEVATEAARDAATSE